MDTVRSLLLVPADADGLAGIGADAPALPDATLVDLMHTDAGGHDAAVAAIDALRQAGHRVYLHTRGPQSPDLREQLLATLSDGVYGVSLPGVVHVDQLRFVDSLLEDVEGRAGIEPGLTALGLWIESSAALGRVAQLAAASSRLTWLGVATAPLAMELVPRRARAVPARRRPGGGRLRGPGVGPARRRGPPLAVPPPRRRRPARPRPAWSPHAPPVGGRGVARRVPVGLRGALSNNTVAGGYYYSYTTTMGRVSFLGYQCERCGHEWVPRTKAVPKVCPRCKSAYWDSPRKQRRAAEEEAPYGAEQA